MRKTLQALAALIAVAAIATWLATGAHRGWSKTSVQKMTVDDVTGIESPRYEKKFVAGVDFLGVTLLAATVLAGASLLFSKKSIQTQN